MGKRGPEHTISWIIVWATARYFTCLPLTMEDERDVWFIGVANQVLEFQVSHTSIKALVAVEMTPCKSLRLEESCPSRVDAPYFYVLVSN
jgi:hypothetical protein